jgi:hypothetical protein
LKSLHTPAVPEDWFGCQGYLPMVGAAGTRLDSCPATRNPGGTVDTTTQEQPPTRTASMPPALVVAAMASAGAGLVHAAAAGSHNTDSTLALLFSLAAAAQFGWAALAVARPVRAMAGAGALLNASMVGAWLVSRTSGWPVVDALSGREAVGAQDAIAAGLGGLAALAALAYVAGLTLPRATTLTPAALGSAVVVLALAIPGMAAEHSDDHGEGAEHAHGDVAAHDDGHAHGDPAGHDGPIISLDDPRVTEEQREAAQALIDDTTAGMAAYTDVDSVVADGYISIGDGVTGWEHFINIGYITDGVDMDPDQIESIVFKVEPDGTKTVASAMYILGFDKTMDDVPEVAGELTTWHDHQDLCWEGAQVVGKTDANGDCANGTFRPTPPMLHVWMTEHRCGPFAGIESHGGSDDCSHDHGNDEPEGEGEVAQPQG